MLPFLRNAKNIGYVFSGGSSRCAFQIGVIETLAELGVRPAMTIGVSAGAWNAAIVSARREDRMRYYWRSFMRMPHVDLRNLFVEHSPWRYRSMHARTFDRYVGRRRFHDDDALPLFISVTRLRDQANSIIDARHVDDPLDLLMATNYVWPFYTHAPRLGGERFGDGGWSDNAPYERALAEGCDAVVLVAQKGESEGGLFKSRGDYDHVVRDPRVVVIRPRHRLPIAFNERRWPILASLANVGYLRAREVLLGEMHPETEIRAEGEAPSARVRKVFDLLRRRARFELRIPNSE
jgi:predicted acylesterase/phospholipase RssA